MNLLDTDAIIELLREKKYEIGVISIITLLEVLRGLEAKKRPKVKELLEESFNIQNLDNQIIEAYCNLYQKLKNMGISLPDADLLIAATAISQEMTLKTSDKHFERLTEFGLKLAEAPSKENESH
ncbi:MAG: type II toxin-antitoxin system VapC family toxin [Methanocellales archaeon]